MLPNHPAHDTSCLHPDYHSHAQRFAYLVQPNVVDGSFSINIFIKLFPSLVLFEFQFLSQIQFVWHHYFTMFLYHIRNWSWKDTNTLSIAECLLMGIIKKKENYKHATSYNALFFWLLIWFDVCSMVHMACKVNQLIIYCNKYLPFLW